MERKIRVGKLDLNKVIWILHDSLDIFGQYAYSAESCLRVAGLNKYTVTHTSGRHSWAVDAKDCSKDKLNVLLNEGYALWDHNTRVEVT